MSVILEARLLDKTIKQPNGCWEFQGCKINSGYGLIKVCGTPQLTHRVAYELWKGEIPDKLHVLHTCDNKCCVNPEHLWVGTHQDNMDDKRKKGRCARHKLGKLFKNKYDDDVVREVRKLREEGFSIYDIQDRTNVPKSTVYRIITREQYKEII